MSPINEDQYPYCVAPFSYELIIDRVDPGTRWRIMDKDDNAVGWAATEEAAKIIVRELNARG